jgi:phosphoadenosine phosphosulfate reductase
MILGHFPNGVLSFIGQRRYESEQRSSKPKVWNNPWTPGQVGASPIQDWTALHVWLYIFSKGESHNIWYDRGLDRIGCYLCPASDLAELRLVESSCQMFDRWNEYLEVYAKSKGLSDKWLELALWRWKKVPASVRDEIKKLGFEEDIIAIGDAGAEGGNGRGTGLVLHMQNGFSPCIQGYTIEGAFSRSLDIDRVSNVLTIIGAVESNDEEGWCLIDGLRVFKEGVLIARGSSPEDVRERVEKVRKAVVKAMECVGCGVCVARCDQGALSLQKDRIRVATSKCKHCGSCIEPCPAISFGDSAFEF